MLSPGGVGPLDGADHMRAGPVTDAGQSTTAVPKALVPRTQQSENGGLKFPAPTGSSGIGFPGNGVAPDPALGSRKDMAAAGRMETDTPSAPVLAKRTIPEAVPGGVGMRDNKVEAPAETRRQSAKEEAPPPSARAAESMTGAPLRAPVPATVPGLAEGAAAEGNYLPPEKWLERIDELRRQGKLEEAKTSLAEFRKRYPDYELPAPLKEWVTP